ncbi:MAG: sulfite exporter TauE/SafE family protein [Ekhidna sp.]|nr:sulfite exporter TauE/SafE family protein [Ekhidna sp.]
MELLEVLGFVGALLIGVTLGLIGGGGSILTVPILVYLLGIEPVVSTAYSLFVVGFSALIGSYHYAKKGLVSYKTAVVFAVPAFMAVYFTRLLLVPALPDSILQIGSVHLGKDTAILLIFAFLMVFASVSMIRNKRSDSESNDCLDLKFNYPMILIEGAVVGVLTGLAGAGGGFLIIPALVVFAKLPMKLAIGTSLLIIASKSLIGFIGDVQSGEHIDWSFLLLFSGVAAGGIFLGSNFSAMINEKKLKIGFGWFVLAMGCFMIVKEVTM